MLFHGGLDAGYGDEADDNDERRSNTSHGSFTSAESLAAQSFEQRMACMDAFSRNSLLAPGAPTTLPVNSDGSQTLFTAAEEDPLDAILYHTGVSDDTGDLLLPPSGQNPSATTAGLGEGSSYAVASKRVALQSAAAASGSGPGTTTTTTAALARSGALKTAYSPEDEADHLYVKNILRNVHPSTVRLSTQYFAYPTAEYFKKRAAAAVAAAAATSRSGTAEAENSTTTAPGSEGGAHGSDSATRGEAGSRATPTSSNHSGTKVFLGGLRFEIIQSGRHAISWVFEVACGVRLAPTSILIHRKSKNGKTNVSPTGCASVFVEDDKDVEALLEMNQRIFCAEDGIYIAPSAERMKELIASKEVLDVEEGRVRGPTHPVVVERANSTSNSGSHHASHNHQRVGSSAFSASLTESASGGVTGSSSHVPPPPPPYGASPGGVPSGGVFATPGGGALDSSTSSHDHTTPLAPPPQYGATAYALSPGSLPPLPPPLSSVSSGPAYVGSVDGFAPPSINPNMIPMTFGVPPGGFAAGVGGVDPMSFSSFPLPPFPSFGGDPMPLLQQQQIPVLLPPPLLATAPFFPPSTGMAGLPGEGDGQTVCHAKFFPYAEGAITASQFSEFARHHAQQRPGEPHDTTLFVGGLPSGVTAEYTAWMFLLLGLTSITPEQVKPLQQPGLLSGSGYAQVQVSEADAVTAQRFNRRVLCTPQGVWVGLTAQVTSALMSSEPSLRDLVPLHVERRAVNSLSMVPPPPPPPPMGSAARRLPSYTAPTATGGGGAGHIPPPPPPSTTTPGALHLLGPSSGLPPPPGYSAAVHLPLTSVASATAAGTAVPGTPPAVLLGVPPSPPSITTTTTTTTATSTGSATDVVPQAGSGGAATSTSKISAGTVTPSAATASGGGGPSAPPPSYAQSVRIGDRTFTLPAGSSIQFIPVITAPDGTTTTLSGQPVSPSDPPPPPPPPPSSPPH